MDSLRQKLSGRYAPVFALAAVYLVLGFIGRFVLWAKFGTAADVAASQLPYVMLAGLVNDAVQALYLGLPLALLILIVPDRWQRTTANRVLLLAISVATIAGLLYLAVAEYFFFEEFDARFNIVAFDYLAYPTEVFTDIWDAYPVVKVLLVAVTLGAAVTYAMRRWIVSGTTRVVRFRQRLIALLPAIGAAGLAIAFYPTGLLAFTENRVENELVQNGHSSFFQAARTSDIDYGAYYLTHQPDANLKLLEAQLGPDAQGFTRLAEGRLDRHHEARAGGLGRLNVVVVSSESFGAEFSKLHGSKRDLTPNFDSFARQGLWFSNTYASGTRTVRGLEAITASFPPIPTVSILRRPGNQHVATWGSVMQQLGYHTSFLYGGYGYFDDMNLFYAGNGFEVLDRADIEHVRFENVWGVSDEDLFDRAIQHFNDEYRKREPFFSIVMTTSNHKPFTFRPGLEAQGIPATGGGRRAGVKYADYALGYFLREAQKQPWFDDTLFVVVADHGARVYGKAEIPLQSYEIPLMFYAPKHIAPRTVDSLMTQIDIAPTVLGLLGLPYDAPFFGTDVLNDPAAGHIALFSHNHDVAIYRDDELVVLGLNKTAATYRYDRVRGTFTPMQDRSGLAALGIAYFQTASELFRNHRYELSTVLPHPVNGAKTP
jgi:phosphoglycerol transferase MdoB-like AlkP superfamily enzyme